jgi:hypothetical protein
MISYQKTIIPRILVVVVGGAALIKMICFLGYAIVKQWYFYPSLGFWIFSILCLITGKSRSWDRLLWRICQWWSGIWLALFILCFCAPPFSFYFGSLLIPLATTGGINSFLAIFAHLIIWSSVTDILHDHASKNQISNRKKNQKWPTSKQ